MASDGAEGGFALKVGLGRLLPCEALRDQIERTAEALQALALRGSLVATTVVLGGQYSHLFPGGGSQRTAARSLAAQLGAAVF
jgi:hypothetical protein